MHPLLVVLLLPTPSLGITLDLNSGPDDGNNILLNGFRCHEHFFKALTNQIEIKVKNATQTTLAQSKQDIGTLLSEIDYMEYIFLQIFHALGAGDVSFSNELIKLYSTFGRQLQLSDYFRSHVSFLTKPTYDALNTIVNSHRKGLKPIPDQLMTAILLVTNKSSVFEEASRRADLRVIKLLLNYVSEPERCSALDTALQQQKSEIVKMLIKSNITVVKSGMSAITGRNRNGESILHLAAESKSPHFVASLLESGAQVNSCDASGATPLHRAVKNNDLFTAKMLIEKHADVNAATKSGNLPLHEAASNGNLDMVTLLLASGSSVGKETDQGVTPLLITEKYVIKEIIDYLFWNNSITVKQLQKDLIYLYFITSYQTTNSTTRRRRITFDHVLENSLIAKELLLRGEKSYIPNIMKSKLLLLVIKLGITKLAQSMFNIGAKLDPEEMESKMIFKDAILEDNHQLIDLMLNEGMSENTEFNGFSALQIAADRGSVTTFNLLINRGADIKKIQKNTGSILHAACGGGRESIVRYLLNKGYRVDAMDKDGNTPLFYAAIYGYPEIVKVLIDHKANPKARNHDMETALHFAAYGNDLKSVNILIEKGAEIEARNKDGETPLFIAAKEGNEATLAHLLSVGAGPEATDSANRTPLEISIKGGHVNTTRLLLENGVNPNTIDSQSRNCLYQAVSSGKIDIVELLLKKGVLVNTPDISGRNALHEAVAKKSLSIVKLLVTSGISINAKDKDGRSPLDYAISDCSQDVVSFLVKKGARASVMADPKCIIGNQME